jgi:predicted nucleic acid-binding protein
MKIYLDNCCYNRPFDDNELVTVQLEADAKLQIQRRIRDGIYDLVWSYMNEYENNSNPHQNRRESIQKWRHIAKEICRSSDMILKRGEEIQKMNIKRYDALHLACAIESKCTYFISTDYLLIRKNTSLPEICIINPINFLLKMEEHYYES